MKNKFINGLLTGLAGGLLVSTILLFSLFNKLELNRLDFNTVSSKTVTSKNSEESLSEINTKITLLEAYIDKFYLEEVDKSAYAQGIYKGLIQSLKDPYSTYYTKEEYKAMQESRSGTYCGIGASVSQRADTGIITIVKPFEGGPAYKAGILPGDIIYKVEGKEVTGEDLTEVVAVMKGEKGTKVNITIVREGESDYLEFELRRDEVEVQTIEFELLQDKIGYISISEFDEVTAKQFRKALNQLEKQGMEGLVIDLRGNGGGRLDVVVDMLDRMLPKGMIVYTKDKNGEGEEYKSTNKEQFTKPLSILINDYSASASEVFAGAIKDYKLGTLVGTTSFGKGIVQTVFPLQDGTALKLTIAKYYTPNGNNIHGIGIEPDIKVELDESLAQKAKITKEEDNQLQKAIESVKEQMEKR